LATSHFSTSQLRLLSAASSVFNPDLSLFFLFRFQTKKKKKKTAPPSSSSPKKQQNMADCGCAPKCACGAEKIGEELLNFLVLFLLSLSLSLSFSLSLSLSLSLSHTHTHTLSSPSVFPPFLQKKKKKKQPTASAAAPPAARSAAARSAPAPKRPRSGAPAAPEARRAAPAAARAEPGEGVFLIFYFSFSSLLRSCFPKLTPDFSSSLSRSLSYLQQVPMQGNMRGDFLEEWSLEEAESFLISHFDFEQKKKRGERNNLPPPLFFKTHPPLSRRAGTVATCVSGVS
jgi:hypothetical protein